MLEAGFESVGWHVWPVGMYLYLCRHRQGSATSDLFVKLLYG